MGSRPFQLTGTAGQDRPRDKAASHTAVLVAVLVAGPSPSSLPPPPSRHTVLAILISPGPHRLVYVPPCAGLMRDLGVPLSATQLAQAISQLDLEQAGKIRFGEFLLWWKG